MSATATEQEPEPNTEEWFEWQNRQVMDRSACHYCGGSVPWSDEFSWKYAAAGGCLEGPFCSPGCYWRWTTLP